MIVKQAICYLGFTTLAMNLAKKLVVCGTWSSYFAACHYTSFTLWYLALIVFTRANTVAYNTEFNLNLPLLITLTGGWAIRTGQASF